MASESRMPFRTVSLKAEVEGAAIFVDYKKGFHEKSRARISCISDYLRDHNKREGSKCSRNITDGLDFWLEAHLPSAAWPLLTAWVVTTLSTPCTCLFIQVSSCKMARQGPKGGGAPSLTRPSSFLPLLQPKNGAAMMAPSHL